MTDQCQDNKFNVNKFDYNNQLSIMMKQEASDNDKVKRQASVEADMSESQKQDNKKSKINNLIKDICDQYGEVIQNTLQNPIELIQQLLIKFKAVLAQKNKIINKYVDFQIASSSLCYKILPLSISSGISKIVEEFNQSLHFHNVWSTKNDILLMMSDITKGCTIDHDTVKLTRAKGEKFNVSLAILNKIPQNSIIRINIKFLSLSSALRFYKQDHFRLKMYPPNISSGKGLFQFSSESIRCLTIDQNCLEKQKIGEGDSLAFKIDLFNRRSQAFHNNNMIKFNDEIKSKVADSNKLFAYIPVLEISFGSRNQIKNLCMTISLDFTYKQI